MLSVFPKRIIVLNTVNLDAEKYILTLYCLEKDNRWKNAIKFLVYKQGRFSRFDSTAELKKPSLDFLKFSLNLVLIII